MLVLCTVRCSGASSSDDSETEESEPHKATDGVSVELVDGKITFALHQGEGLSGVTGMVNELVCHGVDSAERFSDSFTYHENIECIISLVQFELSENVFLPVSNVAQLVFATGSMESPKIYFTGNMDIKSIYSIKGSSLIQTTETLLVENSDIGFLISKTEADKNASTKGGAEKEDTSGNSLEQSISLTPFSSNSAFVDFPEVDQSQLPGDYETCTADGCDPFGEPCGVYLPVFMPVDFTGFVGDGGAWSGPFLADNGATFYAKPVSSKIGIGSETMYPLEGIRYRVRRSNPRDNESAKWGVGSSFNTMEDIGRTSHMQYAYVKAYSLTLQVPIDLIKPLPLSKNWINNRAISRNHGTLTHESYFDPRHFGTFVANTAPEFPGSTKPSNGNRDAWLKDFDLFSLDRIRVLKNNRLFFDSNDLPEYERTTMIKKAGVLPSLRVFFKETAENGDIIPKVLRFAAQDDIDIDLWISVGLTEKEPWVLDETLASVRSKYYEHSIRLYTAPGPINWTLQAADLRNLSYYWDDLSTTSSVDFSGGGDSGLQGGLPLAAGFIHGKDTFEVSLDRLGGFSTPENSTTFLITEEMPEGWEIGFNEGLIQAIMTDGTRNGLSLYFCSGTAARVTLNFPTGYAVYGPRNNAVRGRVLDVSSKEGITKVDFGPQGTFDPLGDTEFELRQFRDSPYIPRDALRYSFENSPHPVNLWVHSGVGKSPNA